MAEVPDVMGIELATRVAEAEAGIRKLRVSRLPDGSFRAELIMRNNAGFGRPTKNAATGEQAIVDVFAHLGEKAVEK